MTVGTSLGLGPTLAYTVRAKDDPGTSLRLRQTVAYTVRVKDDRRYISGTQADPTFNCKG